MEIFKQWTLVPWGVRVFLLKALLLFVVWKSVYLILLAPDRILDAPLTRLVATSTAYTLNAFSHYQRFTVLHESEESEVSGKTSFEELETIFSKNERTLSIADKCNALEVFVLYAGFIICIPAQLSRKMIFIVGGILSIFVFNILRCAGLTLVCIHYPALVDFSHHFIFNIIIYLFIFYLWYIFSKKLTLHAANNE